MSETKEMEVYAGKTALEIFQPDGVKSILDFIREKATAFTPDTSTDKGRKQIASQARTVSSSKVVMEDARKLLVAGWKKQSKTVDEQGKILRDECDALRDEIRKPLTEWEDAEQERIKSEHLAAQIIAEHESAISENELFDRQREIERKEAEIAAQEEKRIEEENAAKVERERAQREEQIKQEAIQSEKKRQEDAISEAAEAVKRAEREKIEAEERAKIQAERAAQEQEAAVKRATAEEQLRVQRIEEEKAETRRVEDAKQKKAAENKQHQRSVNNSAVECLVMSTGIDTDTAKKIVTSIAKGDISSVTINY